MSLHLSRITTGFLKHFFCVCFQGENPQHFIFRETAVSPAGLGRGPRGRVLGSSLPLVSRQWLDSWVDVFSDAQPPLLSRRHPPQVPLEGGQRHSARVQFQRNDCKDQAQEASLTQRPSHLRLRFVYFSILSSWQLLILVPFLRIELFVPLVTLLRSI